VSKNSVRVAIVGVGNCASSLVQGVSYYREYGTAGMAHPSIAGRGPQDIEFVAAFDVDRRKVGQPLSAAIYKPPNNTRHLFTVVPRDGEPVVQAGPELDGVAKHMRGETGFLPVDRRRAVDVEKELKKARAQVVLIYLPVGSEMAAHFYAVQALRAGCAVVNCIPVFLTRDKTLMRLFQRKRLPVIGDDIKSQVGATIVHRVLANLMRERGYRVLRTYQLNVGGNTDFANMLERSRLHSKKLSKTGAVNAQLGVPLGERDIHVGPSDYVPFLDDNKVAFMRIEAVGFCGAPLDIEVRLSVQDSPNSAGVVIDAIRYAAYALDRRQGGALVLPSAVCMKSPPQRNESTDVELMRALEKWCP
jgi:myo-inositol-1-phosphate synthase